MRSGLSLEELSVRTKVSVELWDSMEKNDFSRWPSGVAARAHIRAYAEAVGADPGATVDEFCRVVPQGDRRAERIVRGTAEFLGHELVWSDDLPPALTEGDRRAPAARPEGSRGPWWTDVNPRGLAAGIDLVVVFVLARDAVRGGPYRFLDDARADRAGLQRRSVALLGCSPAVWAIDTYIASRLPHRQREVPGFTRLALMRNDDRSPDRYRIL